MELISGALVGLGWVCGVVLLTIAFTVVVEYAYYKEEQEEE